MKDIELKGTTLLCWQKVWATEVIEVAKFLWLEIDPVTNAIAIDCKTTYKKAVVAFLRHAFPAFLNSPQYKNDRQALTKDLQAAYKSIYDEFVATVAPRIPYWDHVWDKWDGINYSYRPLFQHQKDAVIASHYRKMNFYAMEMRTGKSCASLSHSLAIGAKRTVIVCYDVGKFNFMKDMCSDRWNHYKPVFDPFEFTILDSSMRKTIHAFNEKYVIVNYEALPKYLDYLIMNEGGRATDHIIYDECQRVKSVTTRNHKMCAQLLEESPNARVTLMSGTPIMNRVDDLFAYFKILKHPLGGKRADFERLFLIRSGNGRGKVTGVRNSSLLSDALTNFMIRKRLDECVDVPKKAHVKLYYPIGEYKQAYEDAVRDALQTTGKVNEQNFSSLTSLMAQAKVPGTVEQIKLLVEQGHKVVVFATNTKPFDLLCEAMRKENIGYVRVGGGTDGQEKVARAEKFNTDPDCMVFFGQMDACGHTISLYSSNHTIVLNQPLQASGLKQALFRDVTMTKSSQSTVYYALCTTDTGEATIDEVVLDLNISKYEDANTVIDRGDAPTSVENASSIIYQALMEQYSKQLTT